MPTPPLAARRKCRAARAFIRDGALEAQIDDGGIGGVAHDPGSAARRSGLLVPSRGEPVAPTARWLGCGVSAGAGALDMAVLLRSLPLCHGRRPGATRHGLPRPLMSLCTHGLSSQRSSILVQKESFKESTMPMTYGVLADNVLKDDVWREIYDQEPLQALAVMSESQVPQGVAAYSYWLVCSRIPCS